MEASFSPDFKIKIEGGELVLLGDILTISPGGRCQIIKASTTSRVCGTQLGIYLSGQNDGMKRAEIQLEKSSVGKGGSFWLGLRLPFGGAKPSKEMLVPSLAKAESSKF